MTLLEEFDHWWKAYPRRVGKLAAQKAYAKARRSASAAELLEGVKAYIASKPAYADWCHPTTFLTQGRWMDEAPEERRAGGDRRVLERQSPERRGGICPHEPRCDRWSDCTSKILAEARAQR